MITKGVRRADRGDSSSQKSCSVMVASGLHHGYIMVVLGLRHSDVGVASGLLRKALTGQGNSGIMPFACRDMCLIAARKHLTT